MVARNNEVRRTDTCGGGLRASVQPGLFSTRFRAWLLNAGLSCLNPRLPGIENRLKLADGIQIVIVWLLIVAAAGASHQLVAASLETEGLGELGLACRCNESRVAAAFSSQTHCSTT